MTMLKLFLHYFLFKLLVVLLSPLFLLVGMYLAWRIGFWAATKKLRAILNSFSMGEPTNEQDPTLEEASGHHPAGRKALPGTPVAPAQAAVDEHLRRSQAAAVLYESAHRSGYHMRAGETP